jgi:HEPN domain-containing protein
MQVFRVNFSILFISFLAILALSFPTFSSAQSIEDCGFARTLEDGVDGEDVRCLQKYLNTTGFKIAESGPGASGSETSLYRTLTKEAVIKWQQAKNISPASGVFGDQSRAVYMMDILAKFEIEKKEKELAQNPSVVVPTPVPDSKPIVVAQPTSKTEDQEETERKISSIVKTLINTFEQLDEVREDDPDEVEGIENDMHDVMEELHDMLLQYFDRDFTKANSVGDDVLSEAIDIYEDAGGESNKSKAEDAIDDAEDLLDDAENLYDEAKDKGKKTGNASDLIKKAKSYIEDANDSFDDGIYRQAIVDANDAVELLEDAEDEIDVVSDKDTERYVEEIKDLLEDAEDELDEFDGDKDDKEEIEDMLDGADRLLKKADMALDEEDYSEAYDLAEEAEEEIEEALDLIDDGGSGGKEEKAENELDDAWNEFDDAWDEVKEAEDGDEDIGDAEDLLDEAEELLDEAEDAFDDEDYDEVLDLVDEALDLIDEALDEL